MGIWFPPSLSLLSLMGFLQEVGLGKSHSLSKGCTVHAEASLRLRGARGMEMGGLALGLNEEWSP